MGKKMVTGWINFPPHGNYYEIGERGTNILIEEEVLVKSVHFHLAKTNFDSLLFRVHVYDFKDGFAEVKIKNAWYKLDKRGNVYFTVRN